jgi:8-oxo-dGTP pyrophosphatase MutT (NUDIX family)
MANGIDVTVAAVIERDGQFLLVEEHCGGRSVLNQPAGHLEHDESLLEAVVRETLEETGHRFEPHALVGIYLWKSEPAGVTFLRVTFCGTAVPPAKPARLDDGIVGFHWLTADAIRRRAHELRSPMVLRGIDDYRAGIRYPLACLTHLPPEIRDMPNFSLDAATSRN